MGDGRSVHGATSIESLRTGACGGAMLLVGIGLKPGASREWLDRVGWRDDSPPERVGARSAAAGNGEGTVYAGPHASGSLLSGCHR